MKRVLVPVTAYKKDGGEAWHNLVQEGLLQRWVDRLKHGMGYDIVCCDPPVIDTQLADLAAEYAKPTEVKIDYLAKQELIPLSLQTSGVTKGDAFLQSFMLGMWTVSNKDIDVLYAKIKRAEKYGKPVRPVQIYKALVSSVPQGEVYA